MSADVSEAVRDAKYWRKAYEDLVDQTGRDLNDGLGIDPRRADWPAKSGRLAALQEGSGALPALPSGGQGSSPAAIPTQPLEPPLAELERLALAATLGEWVTLPVSFSDRTFVMRKGYTKDEVAVSSVLKREDADFSAAANPATVLKLIAAVRASEVGMEPKAECTQPNQPRDREEG